MLHSVLALSAALIAVSTSLPGALGAKGAALGGAKGSSKAGEGYGSKLAVDCPANNMLGAINDGKDIFGLCVKPFVCGQHVLTCTPVACGSGEEPFVFMSGAKEARKGSNKRHRRRKRAAVANPIKPTCCKTEEAINGQQLYEFKQYYTIFDGQAPEGKKGDPVKVDAYNIRATANVPFGGEYIKSIKPVTGGYVVGTGYIQCDKTTTERPSTPPRDIVEENPEGPFETEGKGSASGGGCFAGDQEVLTPDGPRRMDELKVGDKVFTKSDSFGAHSFEPVKFFIHREPAQPAAFLTLTTSAGAVKMTPNHLLPVVPCDYVHEKPGADALLGFYKPASQVQPGHCLLDQSASVVQVTQTTASPGVGIYSPITESGTVVVNGLLCSVHVESGANDEGMSFALHHTLFRIVHAVQTLLGLDWVQSNQFQELPRAVDMMLTMRSEF